MRPAAESPREPSPRPTLRAMPGQAKGGRYHHGDLRTALIDTAVELIGERGVRGFSLAEASRRLGVAVSAPYAHFADRDELLAAVTVHAYELCYAELVPQTGWFGTPAERLAAMARGYVRFAAAHPSLFEMLYQPVPDKARHREIEAAERPLTDAFLACVHALSGGDTSPAEDLATAVEATAYGHAKLLLDDGAAQRAEAVELAAERAARATLALIESRGLLSRPALPRPPGADPDQDGP
jgi:AcrR family transcriptional regulator